MQEECRLCSRDMPNMIWYIEGIYTTLTGCNTARQRGWYEKERADKKDNNE